MSAILRRVYNKHEEQTREQQGGFRGGRGRIDQISTLSQLSRHGFSFQKPKIIDSQGVHAVFDNVGRSALTYCLLRTGDLWSALTIFVITSGVRHGYTNFRYISNNAARNPLRNTLFGLTQ